MIICPRCLGLFRTLYQEGKQERCPYCAHQVVHHQKLTQIARQLHEGVASPDEFHQWLCEYLEFLGTWCADQKTVDLRMLDALAKQLDMLTREVACHRQHLQDG